MMKEDKATLSMLENKKKLLKKLLKVYKSKFDYKNYRHTLSEIRCIENKIKNADFRQKEKTKNDCDISFELLEKFVGTLDRELCIKFMINNLYLEEYFDRFYELLDKVR